MKLELPDVKTTPQTVFFYIILAIGILFTLGWGIAYGVWFWEDAGVYSVAVIFCAVGLVGMHLYSYIARLEEEESKK